MGVSTFLFLGLIIYIGISPNDVQGRSAAEFWRYELGKDKS